MRFDLSDPDGFRGKRATPIRNRLTRLLFLKTFVVLCLGTWTLACSRDLPPKQPVRRPPTPRVRHIPIRPSALTTVRFAEVSEAAGIRFHHFDDRGPMNYLMDSTGPGLAWLDHDGDGFMDLYLVQGSTIVGPPPNPSPTGRLFRNEGPGHFRDVTETAGLTPVGVGQGAAVGDIDNDGDPDLFLTFYGRPNALFRNDGGRFVDISNATGISQSVPGRSGPNWSTSAAFLDFDADGRLDLFVGNYVQVDLDHYPLCLAPGTTDRASCPPKLFAGSPCSLYRNRGDGTFEDVSHSSGIDAAEAKALGVVALDLDEDGKTDLFVANDGAPNLLFRNLGDGHFELIGPASGASLNAYGQTQAYMGVDAEDLDGDKLPDLYLTAFANEADTLYHNEGEGAFRDAIRDSHLGQATYSGLAFGVAILDADRDGQPDLFVANGHVDPTVDRAGDPTNTFRQSAQFYQNQGQGEFADRSSLAGPYFADRHLGRGVAPCDYDNDGHPDLAVANSGESTALLHNESIDDNHWVRLTLQGTRSSRDAIGARVTLKLPDGQTLVRHRKGGGGYLSSADPRLLIGLGTATRAGTLEIRWPSGTVQTLGPLEGDQGYRVIEGSDHVELTP